MSARKQTTVQWYAREIERIKGEYDNDEINILDYWEQCADAEDKALQMEREQIEEAFNEARLTHPMVGFKHDTFNDYFTQTYGGTDGHKD